MLSRAVGDAAGPLATEQAQAPLKAAAWMTGAVILLLLMMVAGRESTRDLSVLQVMEMRSVIGFLMIMPLVLKAGGFRAMATKRPGQHVARNLAHYGGQLGWLYAIGMIPLAQVVSIEFTSPIWTAILAAIFLGERLTWRAVTAIALGLLGVVVVIRPDFTALVPGQMIVLAAAVFFGASYTLTKSLTRTDDVVVIIFWMLVIQSVLGLVPAILFWQTPDLAMVPWILLIAFTGTYSHYCITQALRHANATVVVPMDFLRVPLAALVGWLIYSEQIDALTAVGAVLILGGNLINIPRRRSQMPDTAAP